MNAEPAPAPIFRKSEGKPKVAEETGGEMWDEWRDASAQAGAKRRRRGGDGPRGARSPPGASAPSREVGYLPIWMIASEISIH